MRPILVIALGVLGTWGAAARAQSGAAVTAGDPPPRVADRYLLVEEFTADTLAAGEVLVGTDLDVGLTDRLMIGTDLISATIGAATVAAKFDAWKIGEHQISLGLRAAYLNKSTLFAWGSLKGQFEELDARVIRPSIAWTNTLSPRLKLHTFWAQGFGTITARLSDKGKRDLWQAKHPGQNYDERDPVTQEPTTSGSSSANTSSNQEKASSERPSPTQQTIQVQSITGLAQDRFQLSSEYSRANGNKVIVTSRIEQTVFEKLKSNFFRLTVAHQWVWQTFQMRLGIGAQYFVMSGTDLDDEKIDQAGWQPASDIAFYWRF